jgi:hypothetical protein
MKRIDDTEVWTDGVIKYTKNAAGDLIIYVEDTVAVTTKENIVTLDEPVVLTANDVNAD